MLFLSLLKCSIIHIIHILCYYVQCLSISLTTSELNILILYMIGLLLNAMIES